MLRKRTGALTALVVLALSGQAVHAEDLDVFRFDEVVVTATKVEEDLFSLPASVSVITAEDIQENNYQSVAQALGQLPGVYLSPAAEGGITLRGFSSSDILIMVDGVPVNSGWNGSVDWGMIPVDNIERIEIVRGAASSLYGGRATGGVIQITTKQFDDGLHGSALVSYGSNSTWKQAYNAAFKKDKWDFGVGYEKRETDGWRGYYVDASSSSSVTSGYEQDLPESARGRYILGGRGEKAWESETYSVKAAYNFNDHQKLTYSYFHTDYEYSYNNPFSYVRDANGDQVFGGSVVLPNGRGISFTPDDFLGYVGKREWAVHNVAYDDTKNQFHVRFGFTDIKKDGYSSTTGMGNAVGGSPVTDDMTAEELQNWNGAGILSFYPNETKDLDIHKAWNVGDHTLLVGAGYRANSFDQTRYNLSQWRDHSSKIDAYEIHRGKDEAYSAYFQEKWQASDKLAVYAGVRYDHYKKYGGYHNFITTGIEEHDEEGTYSEWSPKFSVEYSVNDDTLVYASYGHSFTTPILYQVYRSGGATAQDINGQLTVTSRSSLANPDLEPETTDTYEIGVKKRWGDRTSATLSLYKADTDNAVRYYSTSDSILYNGILYTNGITQYRNMGTAKKKGVEIDVNHRISDLLTAYLNYAWEMEKVDGEVNYDVPRHLLHFGLSFQHKRWHILADAQYVSERQSPDSATGLYYAEDAFFITNLAVNYALNPQTTAQFTIYNLFDREFFATEAASERTYAISMRYNF